MLLILPASFPVSAGEYFLIDMDDRYDEAPRKLCPMLVENFNRYASEPPMVCIRKFHPDFNEIKLPDWEEIDIGANIDTIERLLREESPRGGYFSTLTDTQNTVDFRLWKSDFDFNSDDKVNRVFRITVPKLKFKCEDRSKNQGLHQGAVRIRYLVEQNQMNEYRSGFWNVNGQVLGDVFLFKDQPYFHSWEEGASLDSVKARSFEWPFPRIEIRKGVHPFSHRESYAAHPVCEIGYKSD